MKIKKIAQIAVCSLLLLTLTGCQNTKDKESANIFNSSESTATKVENTVSDIQKLEGGLSYVEFEGDDCFETFIRQKGVSSDSEVIKFLAANLFAEADRLHFSDVMFGCSTVSVSNENGDRLFGRNFDWQTCNAMIVKSVPNVGYASISTVNTDYIRQGAGSASALLSTDKQALVALYAPIDGMNEAGVCISVNMLDDTTSIKQNTEKPDLTTTTAVRYIESCGFCR